MSVLSPGGSGGDLARRRTDVLALISYPGSFDDALPQMCERPKGCGPRSQPDMRLAALAFQFPRNPPDVWGAICDRVGHTFDRWR